MLDLHLWQWPQLGRMFLLDAAVAEHGWTQTIPPRIAPWYWIAVLATLEPTGRLPGSPASPCSGTGRHANDASAAPPHRW